MSPAYRHRFAAGLLALNAASPSFKAMLRRIVNDTLESIPPKLMDLELGIVQPISTPSDLPTSPQQAEQAQQGKQAQQGELAEQPMDIDQTQEANQAGYDDNWNFADGEEAGQRRLPMFTAKVMAFVQYLLQYKVCTAMVQIMYGSWTLCSTATLLKVQYVHGDCTGTRCSIMLLI